MGRADGQVKLRGFRIELGEIESAIRSHARVREAVVVVKEGDGDQRLVAYVVPVDAKEKTLAETLRAHLSEVLPDYMVPSTFVTLATLPLNPNGKVDRKALPEPDVSFNQSNYVAPVTALEEELCEMWASELKVERVGVMDNFFHLGGHSLLIIRFVSRLYETLAIDLPIAAIYQNANVHELAQYIQNMKAGSDSLVMQNPTLVCLQQGQPDKQPLFVIHPVGGDVFCYAPLLAELNLDCTVYGLQRRELTSQEEVTYQSIDILAENYLMQMQGVQKQGPYRILGWSLGGMIATKLAALLEEQGESVSYLGLIDTIDQSRNEGLKVQLGLNLETLTTFKQFSESMNLDLDEFDQAFEVKSLLPFHRDLSLANLRELIYSGFIAALNFTLNRKVKNLYYYSATNTQISTPPIAIDNILALAEGSVQPRVIEGDHHSIMRLPSVRQLAHSIQQDFLNTVESDERSAA
jgi:thioesterase domain-containing protein